MSHFRSKNQSGAEPMSAVTLLRRASTVFRRLSQVNDNSTPDQTPVSSPTDTQAPGQLAPIKEKDLVPLEFRYGYGRFKPDCLQWMNNPKVMLVCVAMVAFWQNFTVNGVTPTFISTLEKRFDLTSSLTGVFTTMYDVAVLLATMPFCLYSSTGHKGRFVTAGSVFVGIGSIVMALPHFMTGVYDYGPYEAAHATCSAAGNSTYFTGDCAAKGTDSNSNRIYVLFFCVAHFIMGIGGTPVTSVSIAYVDENVSQRSSPMYLAIYAFIQGLGAAVGYFVGPLFLNIYGDFNKDVNMTKINGDLTGSNDHRWIGAWWLCYVMSSIVCLLVAIPVCGFPKELPGTERLRKKDLDQVNAKAKASGSKEIFGIRDIPKSIVYLLGNLTVTGLIIKLIAEGFIGNAFASFAPKLIENYFNMSSASASALLGATGLPCALGGVLFIGWVMRRFRMKVRALLILIFGSTVVTMLSQSLFLTGCDPPQFVGVTKSYTLQDLSTTATTDGFMNSCNSNCECKTGFRPVCHRDTGLVFYSPCVAGCTESVNGSRTVFTNCKCVEQLRQLAINNNLTSNKPRDTATVYRGMCEVQCWTYPIFVIILCVSTIFGVFQNLPSQQVLIRCVPFHQRTMALGIQWIFVRLLGTIPGPIVMGWVLDSQCALWKTDRCTGQRLSCIRYTHALRLSLLAFGVAVNIIIFIGVILSYLAYKPNFETEDGDQKRSDCQTLNSTVSNSNTDNETSDSNLTLELAPPPSGATQE